MLEHLRTARKLASGNLIMTGSNTDYAETPELQRQP